MTLEQAKQLKIKDIVTWKKDSHPSSLGEITDLSLGMIRIHWKNGEITIINETNKFLEEIDLLRDTAGLKKKKKRK